MPTHTTPLHITPPPPHEVCPCPGNSSDYTRTHTNSRQPVPTQTTSLHITWGLSYPIRTHINPYQPVPTHTNSCQPIPPHYTSLPLIHTRSWLDRTRTHTNSCQPTPIYTITALPLYMKFGRHRIRIHTNFRKLKLGGKPRVNPYQPIPTQTNPYHTTTHHLPSYTHEVG